MKTLKERIEFELEKEPNMFSRDLGLFTAQAVRKIIETSHEVSVIPQQEYDAIIVAAFEPSVDNVMYGYVFNDRSEKRPKGQFPDGVGIRTSRITTMVEPVQGLFLVKTNNSSYLVI